MSTLRHPWALPALGLLALCAAEARAAGSADRHHVLVELFTSQG